MRSSLDCIPCFIRQTLDAARIVSDDPLVHESIVREMLLWVENADLSQSPPSFAQHIHRRLRTLTGATDPYRAVKDHHNQMVLRLAADLRTLIKEAADPLDSALRLAVAGNAIDMGVRTEVTEADLRQAVEDALSHQLQGEPGALYQALRSTNDILYLADNAGEIVLDRLFIEQLGAQRVTVAVRGAPVLNDATMADARSVGLSEIAEVTDNGSDAPGTLLADCSKAFRRRFERASLVIAKGQGNFESLSEEPGNIFFLFKVKCGVIADRVGMPVGAHVVTRSTCCRATSEGPTWIRTT